MSGGINMDEEKRKLQYMQFRAEQKLEENHNVTFQNKPKVKSAKDALIAGGILVALVLALVLLSQSGIL